MNLVSDLITDWETLEAIAEVSATVITVALLTKAVVTTAAVAAAMVLTSPVFYMIASLVVVVLVIKGAAEYIKAHWEEIRDAVAAAGEFVQEKVSEFAEAVKLAVNGWMAAILFALEQILEHADQFAENMLEQVKSVLKQMGDYMKAQIAGAIRLVNPIAYELIRIICNLFQQSVTIDMYRLQSAVEQMDRLAARVLRMDARLSALYRELCVNHVEQGEGILVSLANMYHLFSADINVDEGWRIRRKASAISELFDGYNDAEKWVKMQL